MRMKDLSWRQKEMTVLVVQGKQNKEIAYDMGLTIGTVKVYMSKLFDLVGAQNRTELAVWAIMHPHKVWGEK